MDNAFLTIWAGVGPLLSAGVSAWWSNRNRIADRNWSETREEDRRGREKLEEARKFLRDDRNRAINWRRGNFIDFFAGSYDFVWIVQSEKSQETRELHRQKFTRAFGILMLLDMATIGNEAQAVWNACHVVVGAYPNTTLEQSQALTVARSAFAAKAQEIIGQDFGRYVANLEAAAMGHEIAQNPLAPAAESEQ